jgi:NAD(P)H-dependent flavin oxidoreductase YrpB (nitropropane dioxygenase family)
MNGVSHSELATAVTNGSGLVVIGGLTMTPKVLTEEIRELKEFLVDKQGKFGVDWPSRKSVATLLVRQAKTNVKFSWAGRWRGGGGGVL